MTQERLRAIDGLFTGQLDQAELLLFKAACARGEARTAYVGAAGWLGCGKVQLIEPGEKPTPERLRAVR